MSAPCVFADECGNLSDHDLGFIQCCERCFQKLYGSEQSNINACNICGGDLIRGVQCSERRCPSNQTSIANFERASYDDVNDECSYHAVKKRKIVPQLDTSTNATEKEYEIVTCSICLEDINEGGISTKSDEGECNHKFHYACIHEWVNANTGGGNAPCPVCRRAITCYGPM